MNILGVGAPELVLLLLIALIVAGPQRMIRWAYYLGQWTAKLRTIWADLMVVVQREIDEAGLDVKVPREIPTRRTLNRMIEDAIKPVTRPVEDVMKEVRDVRAEAQKTLQESRQEIETVGDQIRRAARDTAARSAVPSAVPANGTVSSQVPETALPPTPPTPTPTTSDETGSDSESRADFGTWTHK